MTVLHIKCNEDTKYHDMLLKKGILNDHLFEKLFITVDVQLNKHEDYLYRKLWESVYIRNGNSKAVRLGDRLYQITITLSEATGYIYQATPPALQHLIEDIESVDDIVTILKTFLMEDNGGQRGMYESLFRKMMRLEAFQTRSQYNRKRMQLLSSKNTRGLTIDVEASEYDVIHNTGKVDDPFFIQVTAYTEFSGDENWCYIIDGVLQASYSPTFHITNVFKDEKGTYVTMYSTEYRNNNPVLGKLIRDSYQNL